MLVPTKIEVRNVRSISHAIVEPLSHGITALSGAIGSGKSSLVNALLWACYGEVGGIPGVLVQAEMRRTGCPEEDPVEVAVDFTLNGDQYRAVRRLRRKTRRNGGTASEVASAELWINGTKQPQITPSKLTQKIEALTGLNGRAFAGAFFCAQFHLPALAEGTPAEVQRMVEDQTGLAPLTKKIDSARQAARDAQTAADALPGSVEAVEAAQAEVNAAQIEGERLWGAYETAKSRAAKTQQIWHETREARDLLAARQRAAQQARVRHADAHARIETTTQQITGLRAEAAALPQGDVTQVRDRGNLLRRLIADVQAARHHVTTGTTLLADARAAVEVATQRLRDFPRDLDTQHQSANERLERLKADLQRLGAEYQQREKAIAALREAGPHSATCPTCDQGLHNPTALLNTLLAQQTGTKDHGAQARSAHDEEATRVAAITARVKARDAAATELDRATAAESTAQTRAAAAQRQATASIEALCQSTSNSPAKDPATLIEDAEKQVDQIAAQIAAADRAATVADQISRAETALTGLRQQLATASEAMADDVADEEMAQAETLASEAHAAHMLEDNTRQSTETDAKVAAERARGAEEARDKAQALLDAKLDALQDADTKRHATGVLAELRKTLLADYTATISDAATALMQTVGGGQHVGVLIDETFIPKVILATGEQRPMRVLSGGEKMRAALCLRLGIADQIVGSTGAGMVFADEITANQDETTTQEIVDLIRALGRPMMLIAHAPQVTQIANRVYEFTKPDETTGTNVVLAGTP